VQAAAQELKSERAKNVKRHGWVLGTEGWRSLAASNNDDEAWR